MSPQALLLRITFLIVVTAIVWNGAWLVGSHRAAPYGTTTLVCFAVWAYDFFVVRRSFD